MVRDRSSEFRREVARSATDMVVLENGSVNDSTSDAFLNDVFAIRKLLEGLSNSIESLKAKQSDVLAKATVDEKQKEELDGYISMIKQEIKSLKLRLMSMKENLEADERRVGVLRSSTDMRIRRNQVESLIKKLSDLIEQFTTAQTEYRQRVAKRIKRQLELAGENATDMEIDAMLDSKSAQVFYRGVTSAAARSALEDASSRHAEILKLEQSITELNDMYNDVAFLVHAQGESVSRIEDRVQDALAHVEAGGECTRQAVRYKKRALHKKIYCYLLLGIVLIIVIAVIVIAVTLTK